MGAWHFPWGVTLPMGVAHKWGGVLSMGEWKFGGGMALSMGGQHIPGGLTLVLTWLIAGRGWHPWGGGKA